MAAELKWYGDEVLKKTNVIMDDVSKKVAENLMDDAKKILKSKAKTTTERGLLSQFYVDKSKFKYGGYLVFCQGPKKWKAPYHASFLEMGTFKDQAKPFMRPAVKKNKRKANKMYQEGLNKL
jgi:HK97 gp10 family phage protein